MLKKIKNIYEQFLKRKKLYYFLKYYNIVTKLNTNEIISELYEIQDSSIPFVGSEDELKNNNNLNISNNNRFINSYSQMVPNLNSSIPYSYFGENNSIFSKTERIPIKFKYDKNNNFKKNNKNFVNKIENTNFIDMFINNMASMSDQNENEIKKKGKNRRTMSYGNLEVKMKRDNEENKIFSNQNNNNIFNNSNIINNTQSLKAIFPSYTITSPNGLLYPIIFTNNNENYINNNNLNNNILFNYQGNTPLNPNNSRKMKQKPSLWYANIFSPLNQIPIVTDNNYTISKWLNNSANFNSISNLINNYSEDYLNKQIFDFINANNKTKQNIISNIGKKHNFKLSKSNGSIKIDENNKINYNNLNKKIKRKNRSYYTMNVDELSQLLSDKININSEKPENFEKSFEKSNKIKKNISFLKKGKENNNINMFNDMIYNRNLKIKYNQNSYNVETNKKNINSKNTNKEFSDEYNRKISNKEKKNTNTIKNKNNFLEQENYVYKKHNINKNNNTIPLSNKKYKNNTYNVYSDSINSNTNNISRKDIPLKNKNILIKKDKINFNIQNVSKETLNPKIKHIRNHNNISKSTLNSKENKKSLVPLKYEISNAVDEQFIHKNIEVKDDEQNISGENSLTMSLQSMNDSKMLELANKYVDDERDLYKTKINDILNDKSTQRIMKKYK